VDRAVEDQASYLRIGRDLGVLGIEYVGEYNLGELLYQAGDLRGAAAHVQRAVDIERRHPEIAGRPLARLLDARLLAFQGDLAAAAARLAEVRAVEARAREEGRTGFLLGPSDQVLAAMIELCARGGSEAEWDALCARSCADSVEQEPIEVHELRGLAALRAGRREEARRALEEALRLAGEIPNVMAARLRAALARVAG
jgi:tetratricopeptide (TPR) repeat protein